MKNISDAADLMATARDVLVNELLPELPKDQRYAGLMIANCLAIAAREHRSGSVAVHGEAGRLQALMAEAHVGPAPITPERVEAELPALRRSLSAAIRAGTFDDGAREQALLAHLLQTAADWVAISNPKALRPNATPGAQGTTPA